MRVELTVHQVNVIIEAFGLAVGALPLQQRIVAAANDYAPIINALQQAAQTPVPEPTVPSET